MASPVCSSLSPNKASSKCRRLNSRLSSAFLGFPGNHCPLQASSGCGSPRATLASDMSTNTADFQGPFSEFQLLLGRDRQTDRQLPRNLLPQSPEGEHNGLFFYLAWRLVYHWSSGSHEWTEFRNTTQTQLHNFFPGNQGKKTPKKHKEESNNHPYFYHPAWTTVSILACWFPVYFSNVFLVSVKFLFCAH